MCIRDSSPYYTVRFSTRRPSSSPRRCGCSDVSTRPIQILFLSECCRARFVGRQAPIGQTRSGAVPSIPRDGIPWGAAQAGLDLPLEYRIRQLLPNFEFVHRRPKKDGRRGVSGQKLSSRERVRAEDPCSSRDRRVSDIVSGSGRGR